MSRPDLLVDQLAGRAGGDRDRVAVDRDQVHQAAVDDVEVATLGPGLLALLQRGEGGGVLAGAAAALDHAVRRVEVGLLAGVELAGDRVGLLLGRPRARLVGGVHAGAERGQPRRDRDHLAAPVAGRLVAGQRPGPADVALAGAGGVRRQRARRRRRRGPGTPATSAAVGVVRVTSRQRERMVGSTSSTVGAQSIQTVRSVGSSIALSSALQAWSVSRSASSTIRICQRRPTGASAARRTRSRTSSTPIESFSVRITVTSAWEPPSTVRHAWQAPQPASRSHWSAAAKATAALERPDPGGPVNSQAWVMPWPPAAVRERRDRGVLADQVVPDGARLAHGCIGGLAEQRLDPLADRGGDLVDRQPRVEHEVVVGVGGGQVEERRAHPLVELQRLALDPVALREPAEALLRLEVEHDGQVRPQVARSPSAATRSTLGEVEGPAGALVGQRGVDVPVGDDDLAALERRAGRRCRRARPCRRRRAAPRCGGTSSPVAGSSTIWRTLRADLGVAGLEGQQYGVARRLAASPRAAGDWVDLPAPSPPSKHTKTPVVG